MPRHHLIIRIFIWLLVIGLFVWIVDKNLAITGTVVLRCSATNCDPRIKNFASKEPEILIDTSKKADRPYRLITVDPLYFDINLYRSMKQVTVTLTYQNPQQQPSLRVGVFGNGSGYEFYDLADDFPLTNWLEQRWDAQRQGDLTLFTRPDRDVVHYESVDALLRQIPENGRIATFRTELSLSTPIPNYQPANEEIAHNVSLRGVHDLVVYLGQNEPLEIKFSVQDINRHTGPDEAAVEAFHGPQKLAALTIEDDGNKKANGQPSFERTFRLTAPTTQQGLYRIHFQANGDDLFIRSFRSKHRLLMFNKGLYLADNFDYKSLGPTNDNPITIFVRGTKLTASSSHTSGLQTITVGTRKMTLRELNQPVTIQLPPERVVTVTIPIRDIRLETDGVFALSSAEVFPANERLVPTISEPEETDKYDYVLARYRPVQQRGSSLIASQSIELPQTSKPSLLIVGEPALGTTHRSIRLEELEIRLDGDPLTPAKIWDLFQRFIDKLRTARK